MGQEMRDELERPGLGTGPERPSRDLLNFKVVDLIDAIELGVSVNARCRLQNDSPGGLL